MMVRTAPKAEFSIRAIATLATAAFGLSIATVAIAASSEKPADIGSVMHRAQTEANVRGFENLIGTLGGKRDARIDIAALQ